MALAWYRAPSLTQLLTEVNNRWPNRSKRTDGTIGDAAHSSRLSDHNPNNRRSVNAIDVTRSGIDPMYLLTVAVNDRRTNYVIFARKIWRRKTGFRPEPYKGPSPHTEHVHISILQASWAEQDRTPWGIGSVGAASGGAGSTARPGLPGTGDGPSSPIITPTGGLTMSEVKQIMDNLDAIRAEMNNRFSALGELAAGRASIDRQAQTTAGLIQATGFNRDIIERNGESAGRHAANSMAAQVKGLHAVLADLKGAGITDQTLEKAATIVREASYEGTMDAVGSLGKLAETTKPGLPKVGN